jgi:hypothetical protein
MVGKKSGRALLREEGEHFTLHDRTGMRRRVLRTFPPCAEQTLQLATHRLPSCPKPVCTRLIDYARRPAAHGQQYGVHHLAAGQHDQSEELLHVRDISPPSQHHPRPHFIHPIFAFSCFPVLQAQWWDGKCSMACERARKMSTP